VINDLRIVPIVLIEWPPIEIVWIHPVSDPRVVRREFQVVVAAALHISVEAILDPSRMTSYIQNMNRLYHMFQSTPLSQRYPLQQPQFVNLYIGNGEWSRIQLVDNSNKRCEACFKLTQEKEEEKTKPPPTWLAYQNNTKSPLREYYICGDCKTRCPQCYRETTKQCLETREFCCSSSL